MNLILTFLVLFSGIIQPLESLPSKMLKEIRKSTRQDIAGANEIVVSENRQDMSEGTFYAISFVSGIGQHYAYVGRVNTCRAGGCSLGSTANDVLIFEHFEYFILFDATGRVILTGIHNYQASHGQEISSRGWLRQFRGHQAGRALEVGKQVDAIAGATISVYAITDDIAYRTNMLGKWLADKATSDK